jgi:Tol biopolymer transport system component
MQLSTKISKRIILTTVLICCVGSAFCQSIIDTNSVAKVFAPGVVSSPFDEAVATFSPDGNTVYFFQGTIYSTVCFSKLVNGKWSKPQVVPFSGRWSDWDPFLSPDGKRLFFVSNRPLDSASQDKLPRKSHLWYADHLEGDNWSAPHYINEPFNLDGISNYAPTVSNAGTLFFYSPGRDKNNKVKSYYVKWLGNHYDEPKGLMLNGDNEVSDPFIAPDESYIVFVSGNDLYISFRQGDGWTTGQKLGPQVNNGDSNFDPTVSHDGKMLYYASARVKGFYKRDQKGKALNYDELTTEMQSIFNGRSNILMIPVNIPKIAH